MNAVYTYGSGVYCHDSKSVMADNNCQCNYGHSPESLDAVAKFSQSRHPQVVIGGTWTMMRATLLQPFWFETNDDMHTYDVVYADGSPQMASYGDSNKWQHGYNLSPWMDVDEFYIMNDLKYVYVKSTELHKVINNMRYREKLDKYAINPQQTYWTVGTNGKWIYGQSMVVLKAGIIGNPAVNYNVYLKRGFNIPLQLLIGPTYEESTVLYAEGGVYHPSTQTTRAVFSRSERFLPCMQCQMGTFKAGLGMAACSVCLTFSSTLGPAAKLASECMCDMGYRLGSGNTCVQCNFNQGEYTSGPGRLQQCQQCASSKVYTKLQWGGELQGGGDYACRCATGQFAGARTGDCVVQPPDDYGYGRFCHGSKSLMADNNCQCNYGHWPQTEVVRHFTNTHPQVVTGKFGWTMLRAILLQTFWFDTNDDLNAHQDSSPRMPANGNGRMANWPYWPPPGYLPHEESSPQMPAYGDGRIANWPCVRYNLSPWMDNDEIYLLNDYVYAYMYTHELYKVIRNMRYYERKTGQAIDPAQTYWTEGSDGMKNYINSFVVLKAGNILDNIYGWTPVEYNVYLKRGYGIPLQLLIGTTYESSTMLYAEGVNTASTLSSRCVFSRSHQFLPCMQCPIGKFKAVLGVADCTWCQQFSTTLAPAAVSQSEWRCHQNYRLTSENKCVPCNFQLNEYTTSAGRFEQCERCADGFKINAQQSGCDQIPCVAWQFRDLSTGRCKYCPAGYYMSSNGAGNEYTQDNCIMCAAGKHMPTRAT